MSKFIKPALLGLGLVAGLALTAQAQTAPGPSVATLPPAAQGPRASSYLSVPAYNYSPVTPSQAYVGPAPGAGTGSMPPRFEKSADWDANPSMKPYDSGKSPRPN
jgi:hypothetical protein